MNRNDQEFMVQKIRNRYTEQQPSQLEVLRKLDAKVRRPATVFAYIFGSISAVIMGAGMSLVMTNLGAHLGLANTMIPGISIGLVGMAMALLTYPIYIGIKKAREKRYAPEILRISDQMMKKA